MAQSQLTVTPENPTPPTNLASIGLTPPNPSIYDPLVYSAPGANPPPVFDDGVVNTPAPFASVMSRNEGGGVNGTTAPAAVGNTKVFAAAHALVTDSTGQTSAAPEGAGTELAVTAAVPNPSPAGQLVMVSTGPVLTPGTMPTPNASHPSSDSATPTSAPTITGLLPVAPVGNGGSTPLTVNGTNFKNGAVVNIGGVPYPTQYNGPTQLVVQNAPKRTSAGNTAITVRVGATTTAATNWVFS